MKNKFGLRQNMLILFTVFGILLIAIIFPILNASVTRMEETLISSRLVADIHYIEDLIGKGDWNIKDGSIYRGDVEVGNGTQAHANLDPFLQHEDKTGTFAYVFIRCGDEGLGYVESTPTQEGYQEGHFLRVAGSTRDPNGKSIVGTYMDKKVADILDAEGVYDGEANVAGGMIFCRYETLKDTEGNVIGAIVVGRGINELKSQISETLRNVIIIGVGAIILGCLILFLFVNRWVSALRRSTNFLQQIETGDIPKERMPSQGLTEIDILNQGINSLADTLTENEELRIKSETDQLTGLANRFGLNHYGGEMFDKAVHEQLTVSVGILDIDYFKFYNDNYGHQGGDDCIIRVADVLKKMEEPGRIFAARYGGDEFIIVTCGMDHNELERFAERIRSAVIEEGIPHAYSKVSSVVTVSQGHYVGIPDEDQSLSAYLNIADDVMYEVKGGSKNGYRIRKNSDRITQTRGDARAHTEDIEWTTYHDYLTQLLNREGFLREVAYILKNNPDEDYYIVRSNIREFKLINQIFGYEKGNEVLMDTADMLRSDRLRAEAPARVRGDHFIFLINSRNYDESILRELFSKQSGAIEDSKFILQYHVGVYRIQDKSMDVSIMSDRANMAINSIHNESDFAIAYYDDSMMENILRENEIIAEFDNALSSGEFRIFLQPIVDNKGELVGSEALARWIRNEDGKEIIVPPLEFIGVLEKSGLIHKLDAYVWEEAAKLLGKWKGTKLEGRFISVNVSPQDDKYIDIEQTLLGLTGKYEIPAGMLNPEFTETTLISDIDRYVGLVSSLQEKGFHVEIDDFGSGYSSLNMLNDIRADVLKLDKNFVGKTENIERNLNIMGSIVEMAKKLEMKIVAEGVETEEQFNNLSNMGCDMFQGYYFSRPVSVDEFEAAYMAD